MHGLMMDSPLLISSLLEYAARYHGDTAPASSYAKCLDEHIPAHRVKEIVAQLLLVLSETENSEKQEQDSR